ncbi:MAG TPA: divalent cation transporter [Gammaproteobacteria bacterium]|nr:divalent cation transporter [Gammaproteobacteria bacterium]HBF06640.1 divalent cation transporter [Gammaproteobacteria bacterium]HCK92232.1 divalent cation transporter [Gammaproteobacteria bacterium]
MHCGYLMPEVVLVILLSLIAGFAMPFGACLAFFDLKRPNVLSDEWRHFIVAFGGGALISAVALVLVPDGSEKMSAASAVIAFISGGVAFCLLDIYLSRLKSSMGQLVAMLSDFIPEAIVLGAAFAAGENTGLLIAGLIILQNIPEGFNAFEELAVHLSSKRKILFMFVALAFTGPIAALTGYFVLTEDHALMGGIMLFASGGILYLVFEDVAPQAKLEKHWMPALGAIFGFVLGLAGHLAVT